MTVAPGAPRSYERWAYAVPVACSSRGSGNKSCCFCRERIVAGQHYVVARNYSSHYDCAPGLGVERDAYLEEVTP